MGANKFVYNDCGATEKSDLDRITRVCSAVKHWEIDSNGKLESRLFQLPGQHSLAIAETITGLELDCLSDGNDWTILLETSAKTVFNVLFSAASMGGAYNGGEFAAFGRRTAWQSLGGLVGCEQNASAEEISARAQEATWALFSSSNDWFYDVAWDIGIACLCKNRNEISILAATDTD